MIGKEKAELPSSFLPDSWILTMLRIRSVELVLAAERAFSGSTLDLHLQGRVGCCRGFNNQHTALQTAEGTMYICTYFLHMQETMAKLLSRRHKASIQ